MSLALGLTLVTTANAELPDPQPFPFEMANGKMVPKWSDQSTVTNADGTQTTTVITNEGPFPAQDPFAEPPGSNFLMTYDGNLNDSMGMEMPNTQPSSPTSGHYLLHDDWDGDGIGDVFRVIINPASPETDLQTAIRDIQAAAEKGEIDIEAVRFGLDILEGNAIAGKAYSGFPLLHYNGPNKLKVVEPILDGNGNTIGGNVDINMIFYNQHIDSDTAFLDVSQVQDVTWTITYRVNILHRGMEDFSPMVMHFDWMMDQDDPTNLDGVRGPMHASMDQTYYPMLKEGARYTVRIKQTKGKYFNLIYTWGWRIHPPRVQATENAAKMVPGTDMTLYDIEVATFGSNPMGSETNKLAAIAMIGDQAPAKRMWNTLRALKTRYEEAQ